MPNSEIQAILDEVKGLGTRFDGVERRLSAVDNHLAAVERRMSSVEEALANVDGRIKSFPDMHYLTAAAKAQLTQTRELKTEMADVKVKLDEIYQSMATSPEIQHLREEVSHFREQSLNVDVRLGTIEGHLGIETNPQPR
jgi:predicted  nucleic acid-binding Zn-ribbon protein